jgi:hypothetical protein
MACRKAPVQLPTGRVVAFDGVWANTGSTEAVKEVSIWVFGAGYEIRRRLT